MIIIKILVFLFLAMLAVGLLIAGLFALGIRNALRRFRQGGTQTGTGGSGFGKSGYDTGRQSQQWQQNTQGRAGEETIIDQRSPEEANRKIFSENDGEYIDFTEE